MLHVVIPYLSLVNNPKIDVDPPPTYNLSVMNMCPDKRLHRGVAKEEYPSNTITL